MEPFPLESYVLHPGRPQAGSWLLRNPVLSFQGQGYQGPGLLTGGWGRGEGPAGRGHSGATGELIQGWAVLGDARHWGSQHAGPGSCSCQHSESPAVSSAAGVAVGLGAGLETVGTSSVLSAPFLAAEPPSAGASFASCYGLFMSLPKSAQWKL